MLRLSKIVVFFLLASCVFKTSYAVETHTKLWLVPVFTGSLSADKIIKFYLQPVVRFLDDKYKFNETLLWMGLGYQPISTIAYFIGTTPLTFRNSQGVYSHANILWQQLNWVAFDSANARLNSRSRIEETKNTHEGPWAMHFRERLQLKVPIKDWERHALVLSDEVFFAFKRPKWTGGNSFFSQNRAYVGIDQLISKETSVSIGYMNQYQFTFTNQMSHILLLGLEVNFG